MWYGKLTREEGAAWFGKAPKEDGASWYGNLPKEGGVLWCRKPPENMEPCAIGFHTEKTYQDMQVKTAFLLICTERAQEDLTSKMNFNSSSAITTCRTVGAAPDAGCS